MNVKVFPIGVFFILLLVFSASTNGQHLTIAAAADLRYAMDEVIKAYQKEHRSTAVSVNYGSSGTAFQQIQNGAPYDIFFSADISYPKRLREQGLALTEPKRYAMGYLVVWSNRFDISRGLIALLNPGISKIAMANPEHAPYGKRAEESLKYHKLYDQVKGKLIFGENISQAAQFVQTGNADVGILALSLASSPALRGKGKYVVIDDQSHSPLEQAYVILKQPKPNPEAYVFVEFVASPAARQIFESYGFKLPAEQ
jgi:molybdate transport system substrate-binding protein